MGLDGIIFCGVMGPVMTALGICMLHPRIRNRPSISHLTDYAVRCSLGDPASERARRFAGYRALGIGLVFDIMLAVAIARAVIGA